MKTVMRLSSFKAAMPAIRVISILAAFATGFSGCASGRANSAYRTHEMGPPKGTYRMSNQTMPNYPGR